MNLHDFRKIHKNLYSIKQGVVELLEVPALQFLVTEGEGIRDVYNLHQSDAMWSIIRVTNRLKEITKNEMEYKFKLMPLEVIWSMKGQPQCDPSADSWSWTAMMQVPDLLNEELFERALVELEERKRRVKVPVRFEKVQQGLCVQALHVGPYHEIQATIDKIRSFCAAKGYTAGDHRREIYINQPFCNTPDKLQTLVRIGIQK